MHLIEQKSYNSLLELWKDTQTVNKMEGGKCKKGPF